MGKHPYMFEGPRNRKNRSDYKYMVKHRKAVGTNRKTLQTTDAMTISLKGATSKGSGRKPSMPKMPWD